MNKKDNVRLRRIEVLNNHPRVVKTLLLRSREWKGLNMAFDFEKYGNKQVRKTERIDKGFYKSRF